MAEVGVIIITNSLHGDLTEEVDFQEDSEWGDSKEKFREVSGEMKQIKYLGRLDWLVKECYKGLILILLKWMGRIPKRQNPM